MKNLPLGIFCGCITLNFLVGTASLQGRIGDSKQTMERRLFSSGGVVYRDDAVEAQRQRGMPYLSYLELMPGSAEVRIYFKTADGRRAQSSDLEGKKMPAGWDLHVVYVGGRSVVEVYKRSQSISEYELNELLARQAGDGYWKRPKKDKRGPSAFGYEMERNDGAVRAKKLGGNAVMVFDAETDAKLAEMNEAALIEKAPVSVEGF